MKSKKRPTYPGTEAANVRVLVLYEKQRSHRPGETGVVWRDNEQDRLVAFVRVRTAAPMYEGRGAGEVVRVQYRKYPSTKGPAVSS
eukprot:scaffold196337_cov20-Prasinocladus_malaysianus.AAC.1